MNIFNFTPSQISTTLEVFPKDRYEVIVVSEPKDYFQAGKVNAQGEQGADRGGLRFTLKIDDDRHPDHKGKTILFSPDFMSDFGPQQGKAFLLAAYGYKQDNAEEQRFNADFEGKDFACDPQAHIVGDVWKETKGKRLFVNLDETMGKSPETADKRYQQFKSWEPFGV